MEQIEEYVLDPAAPLDIHTEGAPEWLESEEHEGHVEEPVFTDDPVRVYLREMGAVRLLNRQGEIDLAMRMEHGRLQRHKALSKPPIVWRAVLELYENLRQELLRHEEAFELGASEEDARRKARNEITRRLAKFARLHNNLL